MFLIENPVLREACFPSARPAHWVEPAMPLDRAVVADIAARHESPAAAATLRRWWDRHPETFSAARGPDGAVAAFVQIAELDRLDERLLTSDPEAEVWRTHLREHPPAADDRVLVMRRWLRGKLGELRSPAVSACWLDVKRVDLQLRPALRRIYSVMVDLPRLAPIFVRSASRPPRGRPGRSSTAWTHHPVWLDFGTGSVDGWLAGLDLRPHQRARRSRERFGDRPVQPRAGGARRLVADGRSNREIGELLFISEKTAGRHLSNIFVKLDVHNRAGAARIAAEQGLTQS